LEEGRGVVEKALKVISKYGLCDHCLGRMFAVLSKGTNEERGRCIRLVLSMERGAAASRPERCELCGNVFDSIPELVEGMIRASESLEFETFRVGSKFPDPVLRLEEEIWREFSIKTGESIKREFNRELGKAFSQATGKRVSDDPDVLFIVEPYSKRISTEIKPVYLYGRYRKLKRGIPLTPLPGYEKSVASVVCRKVSRAFGGRCVFKAAGREDVDVRMLGSGRPFIVEVKRPKRRRVPLKELEIRGEVEVEWIGYVTRKEASKILSRRHRKRYRALVSVPEGVTEEELKRLCELLENAVIEQMTPKRVSKRRALRVRRRRVYSASCRPVDEKSFELHLLTDGGLYIKELISGDSGRTRPSVSSLLGKEAKCIELDVLGIAEDEDEGQAT